jgi:hypothetical protein
MFQLVIQLLVLIHLLYKYIHHQHRQLDYTRLDEFLDYITSLGIRPGFELMGNPGHLWTNFDDSGNVSSWRTMVHDLASRYLSKCLMIPEGGPEHLTCIANDNVNIPPNYRN